MIEDLLSEKEWLITEESYEPNKNPFYETLFTLANGYVGVRGGLEHGSQTNLQATYFAGVFDATVDYFTELANAPSWIGLKIVADGETVDLEKGKILTYQRVLDMKKGILTQLLRWKSENGKITRFESYRLVHLCHKHTALIKGIVVPENYNGTITLKGGLDGYTFNRGLGEQLKIKHFKLNEYEDRKEDGVYLEMKTYNSAITLGMASKLSVQVPLRRDVEYNVDKIEENLTIHVEKGKTYEFAKVVTFYTSRDVEDVKREILKELQLRIDQGHDQLLREHISTWKEKWNAADVRIFGDEIAQKSLRFNIFHLIQSVNPYDERVSVAAKALHGEGYRGHVFWDMEIFMLPFYIYTDPKAARSLLLYRYHNLDAARENARTNGYRGVQFPWESADTGEEVTPKELGDPIRGDRVKIWTGEEQHHIVADVAYGTDHYYKATGDDGFLTKYGAEILLETARFWASRAEFDQQKQMFVINKVIGPDEYHMHVNNSVFTNFMARWNINRAFEYIKLLKTSYPDVWQHLKEKLWLENEELKTWKDVADRLYIPFNARTELYEEFEGYFNLDDIVITKYDKKNMPLIPWELEQRAHETTLVKQADVILLQYLLNDQFDQNSKKVNVNYYEPRTTHRSSLSPSSHAIANAVIGDYCKAHQYFLNASRFDLDDAGRNTVEGIHAASLGGTWQAAINGFAGMSIRDEKLSLDPRLPEKWQKMEFKVKWHGDTMNILVTNDMVQIALQTDDEKRTIDVIVGQKTTSVNGCKTHRISVRDSSLSTIES